VDSSQADPTASGEQLYQRHWLRLLGSAGLIQDLRVASFNTGSGAFLGAQTLATTVFSGMPFEVHALLAPDDKDRCLDAVIRDLRVRQELPIWANANSHVYSLGPEVLYVLDVRYYTQPTDSLNLGEHQCPWWKVTPTATGHYLSVQPSLLPSQQLVVDAVLGLSLGAGDLATVNLPSDEWALSGAAARCYWLLGQQAPAQNAGDYKERRMEAAREYTRQSQRHQPAILQKPQLDEWW
jgi:hypothetical protein